MARADELLATIEAIHAAGLDPTLWPQALAAMAGTVGGAAATLELFDKPSLRPRELYLYGVPPAIEIRYLDHYVALNRRLPIVARDPIGEMAWDWKLFDEQTIAHDPFYMEFLASLDLRYFVGGIVATSKREFAGVCVHRTPKQGHIDKAGLALMQRYLPHVKGAFEVTRRLKIADGSRQSLVRALDCLADAVVLIRSDGTVLHANAAFLELARRQDGVRSRDSRLELASGEAQRRLEAALASVDRLRAGEIENTSSDFPLRRPSGAPAYLVSVRPIIDHRDRWEDASGAAAVVFIHDPLKHNSATAHVLREIFGLTESEASLAQALQAGMPLAEYARDHLISIRTVYSHLNRIKDKTGCRRMPALIRKLNELQASLRTEKQ
jgi:DNA-binding CsgD family transcriptional regulator